MIDIPTKQYNTQHYHTDNYNKNHTKVIMKRPDNTDYHQDHTR